MLMEAVIMVACNKEVEIKEAGSSSTIVDSLGIPNKEAGARATVVADTGRPRIAVVATSTSTSSHSRVSSARFSNARLGAACVVVPAVAAADLSTRTRTCVTTRRSGTTMGWTLMPC